MLWFLTGGVFLLACIVAGVFFTMRDNKEPTLPIAEPALVNPDPAPLILETPPPSGSLQSNSAFLTEAERVTRKFLNATSIEELLPLVRDPKMVEPKMRQYYGDRKIEAPGMMEFNSELAFSRIGESFLLKVRTGNNHEKWFAYVETPHGIQIDWEYLVAWSDIPWQEFIASKPSAGHVFRLNIHVSDYYNFEFSDDKKWQSYQLTSADGTYVVYGYTARGSQVNSMLPKAIDGQSVPLMISIKFPENATSPNQVIIEKFITDGWVLATQSPP